MICVDISAVEELLALLGLFFISSGEVMSDKTTDNIKGQVNDIQTQLLQEIRQKLFGRNVSARGSVMNVHDELWFFPSQLQLLLRRNFLVNTTFHANAIGI
jgi:hypothetical protein